MKLKHEGCEILCQYYTCSFNIEPRMKLEEAENLSEVSLSWPQPHHRFYYSCSPDREIQCLLWVRNSYTCIILFIPPKAHVLLLNIGYTGCNIT